MKKFHVFKKLLATAASAVMLTLLPNVGVLNVSAAEPVTYYVMYEDAPDNNGDWWYQLGSEWDENAEHRQLAYMTEQLKDGDVVIVGNASPQQLVLNVHLSNLTIKNTSDQLAMVSVTGGIDNCFFLNNTNGSVTGNVFNAYVYGASTANFCSNVTNLYSYNDNPDGNPNIGVSGTVAYFHSENANDINPPYGTNFAANTFSLENGDLKTDPSNYTRDISGGPAASASQPAPKPSSSSTASNEYDDVPKTGESSPVMWLSLIAVSCLSASLLLRKSAKQ